MQTSFSVKASQLVELAAVIRNSKDENGSKYAVKRLREMLSETGGGLPRADDECAGGSTDLDLSASLLKLWDTNVVKNASPTYVLNYTTIFRLLNVTTPLLHPSRVRIVHSLLSSGNRTKVTCALRIVQACCSTPLGISYVLANLDFSLAALVTVGTPPKVSGGKLLHAALDTPDGAYARRLWRERDVSKVPTRVALVELFVAMVRGACCVENGVMVGKVFGLKGFVGVSLGYVSKDPWEVQEEVLGVLEGLIGSSSVAASAALALSACQWLGEGRFAGQLGVVIEQACGWLEDRGANEDVGGVRGETVRRVLELASGLLRRVVLGSVDVRGGVLSPRREPNTVPMWYLAERLNGVPKAFTKVLVGLRPARCCEHGRVMQRVFAGSSAAAALYLRDAVVQSLDLKKVATYLVQTSVLVGAYDGLSRWVEGVRDVAGGGRTCRLPYLDVANIWRAVFPAGGVSKVVLTKGLQHSQPLVAHATVVLLDAMLEALEGIVGIIEGSDGKKILSATDQRRVVLEGLLEHSKRYLPGVQVVIGYHAKIDFESLREDTRSHKLSGILRLLRRWARLFPHAFVEENVQMERLLLQERVLHLHPENRLEVVQVLTSTLGAFATSITGLQIVLKVALRDPSESSEAYGACLRLASRQLVGTGILPRKKNSWHSNESHVWFNHACRYGVSSDVVIDFFIEALKMSIKKPMAYVEMIEGLGTLQDNHIDGADDDDDDDDGYVSPLLVCAVEKMCRILKSKARDDRYKYGIVTFVRGVLEDMVDASNCPEMYVLLVKRMVDVEFPAVVGIDMVADVEKTGKGQRRGKDSKRERNGDRVDVKESNEGNLQSVLLEASGVSGGLSKVRSMLGWVIELYVAGKRLETFGRTGKMPIDPLRSKKARQLDDNGQVVPQMGAEALLEALERAKSAPSKYERRLLLAMIAPSLEDLLGVTAPRYGEQVAGEGDLGDYAIISRNTEPRDDRDDSSSVLAHVREAFVRPIIQYFASKDVKVPSTPGMSDAGHFAALRNLSSSTIASVLTSATEDAILDLAAPLLHIKEHSRQSGGEAYCNASAADKLRVLGSVMASLAKRSTSEQPSDALAQFTCEAATVGICFVCSDGLARQRAMELMESLGDVVSDFGESARRLDAFRRMLRAWSYSFVPRVMGDAGQCVELTRCLRRFSAALIPEDSDGEVAFVGGPTKEAQSVYADVCSLFLELITKDFVQRTLRSDAPLVIPPAYLANRLPIKSIIACTNSEGMTHNTFVYRDEERKLVGPKHDAARHKTEMCEFLETMLDIIGSLERSTADEMVAAFDEAFNKAESALLAYLIATYGASLSRADLATWSLIRAVNVRLWRRRMRARQHAVVPRDSDEEMLISIIEGPIATEFRYSWGTDVDGLPLSWASSSPLHKVLPLRCAMTVIDFPEWRHLIANDRLPDSMSRVDSPPEHTMSYEAAGYDPAFFLPMCLSALRDTTKRDSRVIADNINEDTGIHIHDLLVDAAALPLIVRCLGSADVCMRAAAYECLALIEHDSSALFEEGRREVSRLRLLLNWVRQSAPGPFHRFPSIHAVFAAECAHVLFQPASESFPVATKHLCKSSSMDFKRIISVGASKGKNPQQHQGWVQRLFVCGLRSSADVYLYSKAHVFEVSMGLAASHQQPNRDLAVLLVHQASSIPKAARVMAESCGGVAWLVRGILEQRQRRGRGEDIKSLEMLERAWRNMGSWKSIVDRGNGRSRENAQRELRLGELQLMSENE